MADRTPVAATSTVRRNGPAVGKDLAGVVKDDHPVAQQHPALLRMAGHNPGRAMGGVMSAGTVRLVAARRPPVEHCLVAHRRLPTSSKTGTSVSIVPLTIACRPHLGSGTVPAPRRLPELEWCCQSLGHAAEDCRVGGRMASDERAVTRRTTSPPGGQQPGQFGDQLLTPRLAGSLVVLWLVCCFGLISSSAATRRAGEQAGCPHRSWSAGPTTACSAGAQSPPPRSVRVAVFFDTASTRQAGPRRGGLSDCPAPADALPLRQRTRPRARC